MRMGLLKDLLGFLSVEKAFEHIRWLTEEVGERISGTEGDRKAAVYLKEVMESYGLETELQEFEVYNSHPLHAELRVIFPEERTIEAQAQAHIASTPPEGMEGELVYLGAGGEADYEGRDVEGKIVLAELSYSPPRPEKARLAARHGAKALIIMNWGREGDPYLPKGAVKAVWGNPTPETFGELPGIPVIGVSRAAGEYLRALLSRDEVRVWLRAECLQRWDRVLQPLGRIRGTREPEKFVLVGGHLDAWGKGATCNAAGNGLMLELARVFSRFKDRLQRSIVFAFWNGHEIAEAAGSTWYVDNFWDDVTENALAYINIDSPGLKGTSRYRVQAALELKSFAVEIAQEVLREEVGFAPMKGKFADQSFYGVGVPSIFGRTVYDPGELERTHGATLGWWYHSDADTLEKVDKGMFAKTMAVNAAYILNLSNAEVLPMEFVTVAREIGNVLEELEREGGELLGLAPLILQARRFHEMAEGLESLKEKAQRLPRNLVELVNRCLMELSRILLPVMCTVCGRYGQDSYGLSQLEQLFPSLQPLRRLARLDRGEEEFKLLHTKLLRERNRVADALRAAILTVEKTMRLVGGG